MKRVRGFVCAGLVAGALLLPATWARAQGPAVKVTIVPDASFQELRRAIPALTDNAALALLSTRNADASLDRALDALRSGSTDDDATPVLDLSVRISSLKAVRDESASDVIVALPPERLRDRGVHLGAIAIRGFGFEPGLLTSFTTRRDGVISIIDVAPTILAARDEPIPPGIDGRVANVDPLADAPQRLGDLERQVLRSNDLRRPLTRIMLWAAMALVVMATWTVATGKGARRILGYALTCAAAMPICVFAVGAFAGVVPTIVAAVAIGVVARALLGQRAMLVVAVATAATPLIDLVIGAPIADRSPLAHQVAGGGRFYGVDDDVLGMVVGALLVAVSSSLDRTSGARRRKLIAVLAFSAAIVVLGAPDYGAKFGAPLTAVPAFGILAIRMSGRRLSAKTGGIVALGTLVVTALFVVADRMNTAAEQSHIGRAASSRTDVVDLVQRKIEATLRLGTTAWVPAIVLFGGALLYLLLKRRAVLDRGLWGRPYLRAGLVGASVSAVVALIAQDGGQITAAMILLPAATTALSVLACDAR